MKAKKEAIKEQGKEEIGLSGTFLENIDVKFEERNKEKADKALMRNESRNAKENIPEKQESESKSVISRQNLIEEQSNDKELLDLFKIALTPVEAEKVSVGYLIRENILMRKWSSHCVTIGPLLLLKEKWLDEDPEKISVLKYVATYRLFRAGQIAKRNLQESQSKMKVWYDRKAKSRCFEPGERVLVLFPVVTPCRLNTLDLIKWLRKLVTQITWSKLLVDVWRHKCVISICSKHIMKNRNQN